MMTREDMMRELELLPVWQLRSPLSTQTQAPSQVRETSVQEVIAEAAQINTTVLITEAIMEVVIGQDLVEISSISESEVTYISSDDGDWLFVLPSSVMSDEQQQLFQNMCKALRIKTKPAEISSNAPKLIDSIHPKLVLAMGEVAAQTLLHSTESIEALRANAHQIDDVRLIASYDLVHLLNNPADKAKAWNDLCMGLQILQDLKIANN